MNYFWSTPGDNFKYHIEKQACWKNKQSINKGKSFTKKTWENISLIRKGDVIFFASAEQIRAIGVAKEDGGDAYGPQDVKQPYKLGWGVGIDIYELAPRWNYLPFINLLIKKFEEEFTPPITHNSIALCHDYMLGIPKELGQLIQVQMDYETQKWIESKLLVNLPNSQGQSTVTSTKPGGSTTSTVQSRVGQHGFREALIKFWGSCPVTGVKEKGLLKASHIVPWAKSTDEEKTDPYNGILLSPNIDLLFDKGLISFKDNGDLLVGLNASKTLLKQMGIPTKCQVTFTPQHIEYLKRHRSVNNL
jgi:putative restriction endonuclease